MPRLIPLLSIVGFILLWGGVSAILQDPLFPGPYAVFHKLIDESVNGNLVYHLTVTLLRVVAAFTIAMALGTALGIAMGRNRLIDGLGDPWLVFFLNVPALVIIFLCYIWGGLTEIAAIIAVVINKLPNVTVTLREGARALSHELDEMGQAFRFSRSDQLRHIILPQLQPYIAAAARSGLSLIWKIVLVVELFGRSNGIGFQLHTFFGLFDVTSIFAYSLAFIAVMLLIEIFLIQPMEKYATRWRASPA